MDKLEFRPLEEKDYAQAEVFKRATVVDAMGDDKLFDTWFPPHKSYAMWLKKLQSVDPASCVLVWHEGQAIGQLDLWITPDGEGLLNNIYLLPEWRGRGIGHQLNAYALAFFKRHGLRRAALRTHAQKPKLVAFYEKAGWRVCPTEEPFGMVRMAREID